jgi:hypothetical protein
MENKNNPLISCLPVLKTRLSFIKAISKTPLFNTFDSIEDRLIESEKIISEFFVGLPRHYYFYERVVNKMIESYRIRTPEDMIRKLAEGKAFSHQETINLLSDQIRTAPSIFGTYLIGLAGTGKTTIINNIIKLFPKAIPHPKLGVIQIPIVRIQTPYRASRKDLCKSFFRELDHLANTNYSEQFIRYNETDLADQVRRKTLSHMIGTIVLDEIQDLKTSKTGPTEMTLAFIKQLTNIVGVPIVFIGSLEAAGILFGNFQLASRSQGFKWERFEKDDTYDYFINSLFKFRVIDGDQKLDAALSDLYYELTQGVPRLLNLLHVEAQKICLHSRKRKIEPHDLIIASKNLFSSTSLAMSGIKNYNTEIISRYSDLLTIENFKKAEVACEVNSRKIAYSYSNLKSHPTLQTATFSRKREKNKSGDSKGARANRTDRVRADLLGLTENCNTSNEVYCIFTENSIIPHISEVIEF